MRTSIAFAALTLTLASLTGCGSGSSSGADSSYCKELKADKAYFASLGSGSPDVSKLDDAFDQDALAGRQGPRRREGRLEDARHALTSITDALKDAGISFADIAKMQQGQIPKGADPQKLAALAPKLQEMSSAKVETASKNIEKHAKSTCKVTLGSS